SNTPVQLKSAAAVAATEGTGFRYFSFIREGSNFTSGEQTALFVCLGVSFCALLYALMLVGQVLGADKGTAKMQAIADAVREGANAYLARQLKVVALLIGVLVFVLFFSKYDSHIPTSTD